MKSQDLAKMKLPDSSGVYFFMGRGQTRKKILYIGKATSLRDRVRSYFGRGLMDARGPIVNEMVSKADGLEFQKTDSVLEALILEAELIKKFQPKYNTDEKDDKSFNCVVITKEDFPRVLVVRKKDLDFGQMSNVNGQMLSAIFGPFPNGGQLKDALKIIRKIFPFRDKCIPCSGPHLSAFGRHLSAICRPCFNRQIGLCPGVCTGEISKQEYAKTIRNLALFFSGKKKLILKNLEREMKISAKNREFERAGEIKKTVFALRHIQDVSLLAYENHAKGYERLRKSTENFRIEAYDIAHISGTDVVGAMVVLQNGVPKKSDYRKFKIRGSFGLPAATGVGAQAGNNDIASLKEVIERRLSHNDWPLPNLFVADGSVAQKTEIEEALAKRGFSIPVVAVTKNARHRPEKILGDESLIRANEKAILLANAEAHRFAIAFHKFRRAKNFLKS